MKNRKYFISPLSQLFVCIEFKLWLALPSNYLSKTEASREKHKSLSNHFLSRKVAGKITLQDRTKVFRWIIPGISGIIQWKFFKFRYLLYIIRNFLCKFLLSSIEDMYEIAIYPCQGLYGWVAWWAVNVSK